MTYILILSLFGGTGLGRAETNETAAFFPSGVFSEKPDADRFNREWYIKHLTALKETGVYGQKKDQKATVFRFLCLRTYEAPFVIRVEQTADGAGMLFFKQSDGTGGYKPGVIVTNKKVKLDKKQMQSLVEKFEGKQFFTLDSRNVGGTSLDGARWLIEGVHNGKYNLVDRCSPGWGTVRQLGGFLIKSSGEKIKNLD